MTALGFVLTRSGYISVRKEGKCLRGQVDEWKNFGNCVGGGQGGDLLALGVCGGIAE